MMLELHQIKEMHDKAFQANQTTREQAADDLVFYWVTQWDDQLLNESQLQYRGQFDIVRKAGRQILAQLKQNPIQPDFKPVDESRTDDAELMDGMYRAADRELDSQEAYDGACQDAVVCGFGAWELYTEYESDMMGDDRQVVRRRFISEANNNAFCDPNAKRLDKSDAMYWSILYSYTEEGYKDLVEELTGERPKKTPSSFKTPETSFVFPWLGDKEKIYVTCFYHKEKVRDKIVTLSDPFGSEITVRQSSINEIMDELVDAGYNVVSEKDIKRWQVTKYIASGTDIIATFKIAGQNIPVIPLYGERTIIEGEEYYEGIVRLAKDPQRLRNFQMSYLADIVSQSPRNKPIFFPEQIAGFESMYQTTGADNNYPYMLINRKAGDGTDLPAGVAMQLPDQNIPPALAASIQLTREAVEDVANPALPQNLADPDLSGKAIFALQSRLDQQNYQYQHNLKFAKRRDAMVWAGMMSEIMDTPRTVMIETPDGQTQQVQVMETIIDKETGEPRTINDVTNLELKVFAEIGQEYTTQKQQTREELLSIATALDPADPLKKIIMMKGMELMDGVALDDIKAYIRKELLVAGIRQPETEEDMMVMQQLQQAQQGKQDPLMVAAQAEMMKGQAEQLQQQREMIRDKANIINERTKIQIAAFNAQTQRHKVEIEAKEKGVRIQSATIETQGKLLDNQKKKLDLEQAGIAADLDNFEAELGDVDTDTLIAMAGG